MAQPRKPWHETTRAKIWAFMADFIADHHNAPSTLEIARNMGLCQTTVYHHLQRLIVEGKLQQIDGRWKLTGADYIRPAEV